MIAPEAWVPVAEVMRPHGVRGEIRLKIFNSDSDVLLATDEVLVRLASGEEHEVSVDAARRADQAILIKLHSIDSRDRADELRGAHLCIRRDAFPPLEDGEFYACDIVGAKVVLRTPGQNEDEGDVTVIGTVREFLHYPSVDALAITATDGLKDFEVPLVHPFVETVDVESGRVILATLDGVDRS